ncbi:MAG: hypothetical protein JXB48_07535, partial [Candidatus Latescibacteria bacterium]|nr:hypothetical protein [Candidatus Latescibacterota bacterium]
MKHVLFMILILAFCATSVFAAPFAPTLLKVSAASSIEYAFDGKTIEIPVKVSGTKALMWFFVYTKDKAETIAPTTNGFMGWHYVNKIDTCVYMSTNIAGDVGNNIIEWEGVDNDGNIVPAGEYTYYIWAYDAFGAKTRMAKWVAYDSYHTKDFQEVDEEGNPLANPIYYNKSQRWVIGNDPDDDTLIETCAVTLSSGFAKGDNLWMDQNDFDYVYQGVRYTEGRWDAMTKWKWVPNGAAEMQTDFGDNGYAQWSSACDSHSPVTVSDKNYIYTVDQAYHNVDGNSDFIVIDMEGSIIAQLDMSEWWNDPNDLEAGGQMNGGPDTHNIRNGYLFFNSHGSCLNQMVDPLAWLESEDEDDFYKWANGNGDYILDHNEHETDPKPWVCNDYNIGPYKYNIGPDANLFSVVPAYDMGAVSFGLLAPDGTGVGYLAYAGETAGFKISSNIVDSNTPFDGLYTDNNTGAYADSLDVKVYNTDKSRGVFFIGHDTIKGTISNQPVAVEEAAPV